MSRSRRWIECMMISSVIATEAVLWASFDYLEVVLQSLICGEFFGELRWFWRSFFGHSAFKAWKLQADRFGPVAWVYPLQPLQNTKVWLQRKRMWFVPTVLKIFFWPVVWRNRLRISLNISSTTISYSHDVYIHNLKGAPQGSNWRPLSFLIFIYHQLASIDLWKHLRKTSFTHCTES